MVLDYIALGIMIFLILLVVWIVLKLGALPGKIAAKRGHPQVDAIRVAGWIGILTMGVFWPLALVWAYTVTSDMNVNQETSTQAEIESSEPEESSDEEETEKEEPA